MSEKVVITKEQAEELINLGDWSNREILKIHSNDNYGWDKYKGLNGMDFDTLARALYNGYEVKLTKEEELAAYYKEQTETEDEEKECEMIAYGIRKTLEILKIEIEGISK